MDFCFLKDMDASSKWRLYAMNVIQKGIEILTRVTGFMKLSLDGQCLQM